MLHSNHIVAVQLRHILDSKKKTRWEKVYSRGKDEAKDALFWYEIRN